ncbi:TetR/AcrR family transcriptional regulator [Saccharibacillus qingshengii]|uniref:TetR/AcrR family transcriptional regulator n=1 Tax=Saccharibacillus qingshengii TaxID=1763540 RepID=UPI0015538BC8|nr:TetR/AcrR family transcriptional regulator [Saccharibacillus qingshengii]
MTKKELTSIKQMRLNTILDEATTCLIENPGASMNEIAEAAGIGIATLHRYVESREQLMVHLSFRAIEVVAETIEPIKLDETNYESYIPKLIEALIPLGDKIYFLDHEVSVNRSKEVEEKDQVLREPLLHAIGFLQQKGYFRQDANKNWIVDVLYSLLFLTWQQVADGNIARNSAAELLLSTFYHGFKQN